MKSMTGYGSGVGAFPGGRVSVELRTVNHRFVEIKMPLPREFLPWESAFRTAIDESVNRGKERECERQASPLTTGAR